MKTGWEMAETVERSSGGMRGKLAAWLLKLAEAAGENLFNYALVRLAKLVAPKL